jgi:NADH dehydrogenase [ubiquinone] 1 alpha subcomplex assembly factor 1
MGQAMRMMSYDRAANERSAVTALQMAGHTMSWYRLDDGVMGGQSETNHVSHSGILHFTGIINTDGGGFTSIRSKIPEGLLTPSTEGIKLRFQGDGKTYKFFMTDGNRSTGSPMSRTPSWQADLPTKLIENENEWEEATIPLSSLIPNFGGSMRQAEKGDYTFDVSTIREVGLMLSLKLASGQPNPKETFGEGIFPFSFKLQSIEPVPIIEPVCEAKN